MLHHADMRGHAMGGGDFRDVRFGEALQPHAFVEADRRVDRGDVEMERGAAGGLGAREAIEDELFADAAPARLCVRGEEEEIPGVFRHLREEPGDVARDGGQMGEKLGRSHFGHGDHARAELGLVERLREAERDAGEAAAAHRGLGVNMREGPALARPERRGDAQIGVEVAIIETVEDVRPGVVDEAGGKLRLDGPCLLQHDRVGVHRRRHRSRSLVAGFGFVGREANTGGGSAAPAHRPWHSPSKRPS